MQSYCPTKIFAQKVKVEIVLDLVWQILRRNLEKKQSYCPIKIFAWKVKCGYTDML